MRVPEPFLIYDIDAKSGQAIEPMGTKSKVWLDHEHLGKSLFKLTRVGTGEDWAEKIAAELYSALGLPHAHYELAKCNNARGVLSPTFLKLHTELVPGNELLIETIEGYPRGNARTNYRTPQHHRPCSGYRLKR